MISGLGNSVHILKVPEMFNPLFFRSWLQLQESDAVTSHQVVTHLTHIEDLPLIKFNIGVTEAYNTLKSLTDLFAGKADTPINLSVKIDGAPSIMVGTDPEDGNFFVATKGPSRIAKSQKEIDAVYGSKPGLHKIMSLAFNLLKDMSWPSILQGDVLFTPDIKQPKTIDDTSYITFRPNTITYAVPAQSRLGLQIIAASFGISFHTTYTGLSLKKLTATPGANVDLLNPPSSVVFISNQYRDLSGTISFTNNETTEIKEQLRIIQALSTQLSTNALLTTFKNLPLMRDLFMQFQNQLVRQGKSITPPPTNFLREFSKFLNIQQQKEEAKRLTPAGKTAVEEKFTTLKTTISANASELVQLLDWQKAIITTKLLILKKINNTDMLNTYYDSDEGLVAGPHEGFVAADSKGNFVKLVDRSMFSRLNFTQGKFSVTD